MFLIDAVEAVEAAEASIDSFIDKRSKAKDEANQLEAAWSESTRRVNEKRRRANRLAWIAHHGKMHRVHLNLADQHADKRSRLLAEGGYKPEQKEGE